MVGEGAGAGPALETPAAAAAASGAAAAAAGAHHMPALLPSCCADLHKCKIYMLQAQDAALRQQSRAEDLK